MAHHDSVRNALRTLIRGAPGLKALVVDRDTAATLGLVEPYSQLMSEEVCHVEVLVAQPAGARQLLHLHAIVLVRPTEQNVALLCAELAAPRFRDYQLCFANVLRRLAVEQLAEADVHERVVSLRESFLDFLPLRKSLVSLGDPLGSLDRAVDGVLALMVMRRRIPQVRYDRNSAACRNLAERLAVKFDQESSLFQDGTSDAMNAGTGIVGSRAPLLLILDRVEDPVTPLLNQWTYEAMIHELLGIQNNTVSLKGSMDVKDEFEQVVLDAESDEFFARNMFSNFGDLGANLKELVDNFSSQRPDAQGHVRDLDDMLRLVEELPEFRRSSSNVTKHVLLTSELSRRVDSGSLLRVSQLEQDLACRESEAEHRKQVLQICSAPGIALKDKVRVVLLFALRYEQSPTCNLSELKIALQRAAAGSASEDVAFVDLVSGIRRYAGAAKRHGDVFSNRSFLAKAATSMRRGIHGIENIYTQHEPLLAQTLDDLLRARLSYETYPVIYEGSGGALHASGSFSGASAQTLGSARGAALSGPPPRADAHTDRVVPRDIVVMMVGGCCYEEYRTVSGINGVAGAVMVESGHTASAAQVARSLQAHVVLASSHVLNSSMFLEQVRRVAQQ
ncbi:Vacuolar protein sorting-associated protein 45 [Porphyridium purpureum]|uniref:Vacuolar protein sorting-associated protein 45 n=1 Tax=Porphyridium purpureum TaxID=35688 RepID=A0A5J4YIR1_PORPP|nr:Vacuolar protein sorting-associated protein 45 [Porphyridium purpureum]|eukprot:POR3072..scf243_20